MANNLIHMKPFTRENLRLTVTRSLGVVAALIAAGCADPVREEVLTRFDSGEKQVVVVYRGAGVDEQLIERRTFDRDGTLILLEDLQAETTKTYVDLHPDLRTTSGLADFLTGTWYEHKYTDTELDVLDAELYVLATFSDSQLTLEGTRVSLEDGEESEFSETASVIYRGDLTLEVNYPPDDEAEPDAVERPDPLGFIIEVDVRGPQEVMLREHEVFEEGVRLPTWTIFQLHRDPTVSESQEQAWGQEYEQLYDEVSARRQELIEQHFPRWAATLRAEQDLYFSTLDDVLDDPDRKRERAEELRSLLDRMGMELDEFQETTGLTDEELAEVYGITE